MKLCSTCFYGIIVNYLFSSFSCLGGLQAEDWVVGCGLHGVTSSRNPISFPESTGFLVSGRAPVETLGQEGVMNLGLGTSAGIGE